MNTPTHCMIDLETLGTSKTSSIMQLAAVKFYQEEDFSLKPTSVHNLLISPESCQEVGLTFDLDTVMWWMRQSEEAKRLVFSERGRLPLKEALKTFTFWLEKDCRVWGNGASFDLSILDSAYRACGTRAPWKHGHERCYRTLNSLIPQKDPGRPPREGVHHDGLSDCYHQIKQLDYVLRTLKVRID